MHRVPWDRSDAGTIGGRMLSSPKASSKATNLMVLHSSRCRTSSSTNQRHPAVKLLFASATSPISCLTRKCLPLEPARCTPVSELSRDYVEGATSVDGTNPCCLALSSRSFTCRSQQLTQASGLFLPGATQAGVNQNSVFT